MIRQASDINHELVLSMAYRFINSTQYSSTVDQTYLEYTVQSLLSDKDSAVFLYDDVGFIAGTVRPYAFGPQKIASEIGWWVAPTMRSKGIGEFLLTSFEEWGKEKGCSLVTMTGLGDKEVEDYYIRQGYKLAEYTYMKEL